MLSGVSLSADRFFYPNPLESNGQHQRSAWFGCACCPSNIARFVPAIPGYIYAVTGDALFVNLYISNDASVTMGSSKVNMTQKTDFPWTGKVELSVNPDKPVKFVMKLRIPGWAQNEAIPGGLYKFEDQNSDPVKLLINRKPAEISITDGYAVIKRKWKAGDKIELDIPMPVRKVAADKRISDDKNKMAIQKGPLIYCAEWPDNNSGNILNLMILKDADFTTEYLPSLLQGTQVIKTSGNQTKRTLDGKVDSLICEPVTLIPYALWNNRGPGQMMVWLPVSTRSTHPLPAATIAFKSKIRASKMSESLSAVNDQIEPSDSTDKSVPYYNWWPVKETWEWVEYDFEKPLSISKTKVYWLDDGPDGDCRIPEDWEILYLNGNVWEPVSVRSRHKVSKDEWNVLSFKPVVTQSVKIKVKLKRNFSAGIYEWVIE
jgi:uncharacterized protein